MVTPAARRKVVLHLQALLDVSRRRACRISEADRMSMRYQSRRGDDVELRGKLRALAQERRWFGYRRLLILLRRDGVIINRKKTQRLYREEGLTVRRRKGRKRAVGTRTRPSVLALPNQCWSPDFVHDQLVAGRRFRVLNIVDDVTRECLRAVTDTSISGLRVVRELAALFTERGKPGMIDSDNGTELTSNAVLAWCWDAQVNRRRCRISGRAETKAASWKSTQLLPLWCDCIEFRQWQLPGTSVSLGNDDNWGAKRT